MQRSKRQLIIGGSQARHPSPVRCSKQDCRVWGRRPPGDDIICSNNAGCEIVGLVHGGESGSAAEQRVPHALGVEGMMRTAAVAHRPVLPAFGGASGGRAAAARYTTNGHVGKT